LSKCCCGEVTVEISYYITWWSLGCLVYYLQHWCFWFMVILFILLSFIYLLFDYSILCDLVLIFTFGINHLVPGEWTPGNAEFDR
jgi:hypothetical protein